MDKNFKGEEGVSGGDELQQVEELAYALSGGGPAGTRFFGAGPGGPEPDSQIHHGPERGHARVLPFRGLVTVLQDPARRAGTASGRDPAAGSRCSSHQL
jgi:hypothetical protein